MSVSGKDGTTFGGVSLNPAWFISRTSGTMPTGGNYSAGVWFSRLGTGFAGFGGIQYLLYWTDGTHVAKIYVDNGTHNFTLDVDGTPLVGSNCDLTTQHHVAMSLGGTTAELIVDGSSQGTITVSAFGSLTQLRVGAQDDGFDADKADGDFTGAIFYSRALTAAQWNTQHNTSIAPVSTTNIFAYLRLASAAGGTADLSGNGFDFTNNGLGDGLSEPTFSSPDVTVAITGNAATASAGSVTTSRTLSLTGNAATASPGSVTTSRTLSISGNAATASAGTVAPAFSLSITGNAATGSAGNVTPSLSLALTGNAAVASPGTVAPALSLSISGNTATVTAGNVTVSIAVAISGNAATASPGTVTTSGGDAAVAVTVDQILFSDEKSVRVARNQWKRTHDN